MLVLYSAFLSFPGGGQAANWPVPIRPHASNTLALLFTNQSGTNPAPNPLTTDGEGKAMFWAAPGDYEATLAGEHFHIPVDDTFTDPVWPDLFVHTQASPASVWAIAHHFGVRPSVDVLVFDQETSGDVTHTDDETVVITFGAPTTGVAHLRR